LLNQGASILDFEIATHNCYTAEQFQCSLYPTSLGATPPFTTEQGCPTTKHNIWGGVRFGFHSERLISRPPSCDSMKRTIPKRCVLMQFEGVRMGMGWQFVRMSGEGRLQKGKP